MNDDDLLPKLRHLLPGVPDMTLTIVVSLVSHELGKLGGRPKKNNDLATGKPVTNPFPTGSEPDAKPSPAVPSGSGSLVLFSPDPVRQISQRSGSRDRGSDGRPVNAQAMVIELFCEEWQGEYGAPYIPTPADKSQVGRLLREFADTAAIFAFPWARTFRCYLEDKGKWAAEENRHALKTFCAGGLNKYRVKAGTEGLSQREVRGMAAAAAFAKGE